MADIQISVPAGESKRLLTEGKYCDRDIVVTAESAGEQLEFVRLENQANTDLAVIVDDLSGGGLCVATLRHGEARSVLRGSLVFSTAKPSQIITGPEFFYYREESSWPPSYAFGYMYKVEANYTVTSRLTMSDEISDSEASRIIRGAME